MRFNNGSQVEYEDCPRCRGDGDVPDPDYPGQAADQVTKRKTCDRCKGEKVRLLVTRPAGGTSRYGLADRGEFARAYRMALEGPAPKPQPQSKRDFGDDPPF